MRHADRTVDRLLTPYAVAAGVVGSALFVLGALVDAQVVSAAYVLVGLVFAWGWPVLLGLPRPRGSSLVLVAGVVAFTAAGADADAGMRWLGAALAVCLGLTFLHELTRTDGREALVVSIAGSAFGLGVLAGGAFVQEAMTRSHGDLAVIAAAGATALAIVVDHAFHRSHRLAEWTLPAGLLLGAALGLLLGLAADGTWNVLLLTGLVSAGVAHALRHILAAQPTGRDQVAQLAIGTACTLVAGIVPTAAMWALVR